MVALINAVTNADNMIGTAAAPQAVTKDNIYDYLVDARVALTNAGALMVMASIHSKVTKKKWSS